MKLPPKTLHNRNKDFDDVSDLTMNFHPKHNFSSSNNNGNGDPNGDYYDEEARSEGYGGEEMMMSETSSIYSDSGSNVGSATGGNKKRSKNKLSKYLKRAVGNKGSGSVTKSRSAVSTAAAAVSNGGGAVSGAVSNSSIASGGGNTPQINNMRKTVADQMVANMFSNSSGNGIERAKSWKAETQQQQQRLSMSNNNSDHSMEYSSLSNTKSESVTKLTALGYRSEAVGAAAMAVEFGYTPVGKNVVGGEGDGSVRRASADSEPTSSSSSPMKRGGHGSGVMLNRRSTVAEGDLSRSKSMNNLNNGKGGGGTLSDLELLGQTVQCVNSALQLLASLDHTTTKISTAAANIPSSPSSTSSSYSAADHGEDINPYIISSFKFNPRGCVWYATLKITKGGGGLLLHIPLKVTCHANNSTRGNPNNSPTRRLDTTVIKTTIQTTYTVTISYYEQPTSSNPPPNNNSSNNMNVTSPLRSSFHSKFPSVINTSTTTTADNNNEIGNELSNLWYNHTNEITKGMEWLRRKLRRCINRDLGGILGDVDLVPDVSVVFPTVERKKSLDIQDLEEMKEVEKEEEEEDSRRGHHGQGRGRGGDDEHHDGGESGGGVRSTLKKNGRGTTSHRSLASAAKTATTCSVSTHSPVSSEEERRVETVIMEDDARIQEARLELVGALPKKEQRQAKAGLMSQKTVKRLSSSEQDSGSYENMPKEKNGPTLEKEILQKWKSGLVSQNTMKRLLSDNPECDSEDGEIEQVVKGMESQHRAEGEIRMAKAGLVSRNTMLKMRNYRPNDDQVDYVVKTKEASNVSPVKRDVRPFGPRRSFSQTELQQLQDDESSSNSWEEDQSSQVSPKLGMEIEGPVSGPKKSFDMNAAMGESFPDGEMRQARRGLVSQNTMRRISTESQDPIPVRERRVESNIPPRQIEIQNGSPNRRISPGETRMLQMGCGSRRSLLINSSEEVARAVSQQRVSFPDLANDDVPKEAADADHKPQQANVKANVIVPAKKKVSEYDDDDDDPNAGMLVFSNKMLEQPKKLDVLSEGQYFLGISMLVYMYSSLRENCRMGHTRCHMDDMDTHSIQSQYKGGEAHRYLDTTKTAGSIIRLVIDELDDNDEDDADHEIVGGESKEYERQQTAQFRKWIDDSRISQMDEETEKMLLEMKRKVARLRWKRAISAVRLSYRISGGIPPRWENPVVAPGCENCNRFIDMKEMEKDAMRKQPKYFKEGSVMNNLIESGIEVVWFSDLSQQDVVYGICVQREEKKITVVFRGTVNAHNWSMNFKFDTNEYRNPVKVNYPGREDELSLHSGFALYLLRKRKDTGMSKMDEIFEKVEQIGKELAPDGDYKLCITGHSLGGALATLCGFYCGAKPRFAHLSTIYIWTFAAPRVGTQAFIHAYQHLERTGRIRHARFSCTQDIVPLIPFCNFEYDDLQFYKHVGMRIQLHDTGRVGKWRLARNLDVTYPLKHDWPSEIQRVSMNNILANLNTPKGFGDIHGLTEHQRRLHFAMTYRKALGSSTLAYCQRRKRIKTLDEYYLIRANISTEGIAEEVMDISKVDKGKKQKSGGSKWLVRFLVAMLLFTWVLLILSISTDIPLHCVLTPFTMVLHGIEHLVCLPMTASSAAYHYVTFQTSYLLHSMLGGTRHVGKSSFVKRKVPSNIQEMKKLAADRVKSSSSHHVKEIINAKSVFKQEESSKLLVFDVAAKRLLNLASVVDNSALPQLDIGSPVRGLEQESYNESATVRVDDESSNKAAQLEAEESKLKSIQEYATSVTFAPKLENGLYLVGAGVRKKSVVKVYAVAMYGTPKTLASATSPTNLRDTAGTFGDTSSMTSFVLEMVYSAGAEKIAGAIGESVKPRHNGDSSDIAKLESLIVNGVNAIGGQAIKGTIFRFDCSDEGVSVSVNGADQGMASFEGLGSAFVDVFMDSNSVSPTLIDSCVKTWSTDEMKSVSASLIELANVAGNASQDALGGKESQAKPDEAATRNKVESQLKPIQEYATSVVFQPKLDDGLYLVGAGVRKKSVVKVYAVALYSSASVLNAVAPATLRSVARKFDALTPTTSFVLEMTYSAGAEKIGGAIAESVKPRYNGPAADVSVLESLIVEGVNKKGGQATKGTIFRFDCSAEGVAVSVDGSMQGTAKFDGMGSAFVDVFLDDDAVSPTLVSSCMDTWSNPQAKAMAASLLELGGPASEKSSDQDSGESEEDSSSSLQTIVESNVKPIQEYATSVTFVPKLDDSLYLVGAGVRKKSIVKVYAVALYSSPAVLQALVKESSSGMRNAARSFSPSSPMTSFVLEMTYSAGAEKIAGAIAESVKPRYSGNPSDISELEALIVKGVNMKGGQASKGTIFRFDCSGEGVRVSVDGSDQGVAAFEGMGSAFVDVFLDDDAVSPSLIDSCVDTWSKVPLG